MFCRIFICQYISSLVTLLYAMNVLINIYGDIIWFSLMIQIVNFFKAIRNIKKLQKNNFPNTNLLKSNKGSKDIE